jgi:hypothetical protein
MDILKNIVRGRGKRRRTRTQEQARSTLSDDDRREARLTAIARKYGYSLDELAESIHAEDYDLDEEGPLLRLIDGLEHERNGGNFAVARTDYKVPRERLLELDHFPTIAEAMSLVSETYGGGTYSVVPVRLLRKRVGIGALKRFRIPGRPKLRPDLRAAAGTSDLKAVAIAYLDTLKNDDPQLAQAIQLGIMEKELGIKIPKWTGKQEADAEETAAEREEREYLESHPEVNEQYILSRLRKKGLRL